MNRINEEQQPEAAHEGPPPNPSGIGRIAWRHKWLLLLGLLVGTGLGALYFVRAAPVYMASAKILVIQKRPDASPLPGMDPRLNYMADYLGTHQILIRSPLIVNRAVEKANLQSLPSLAHHDNPTHAANAIIHSLTVSREGTDGAGGSNILALSYRSSVAEDCPTVVNAIVASYKEFLDETYKNVNDDTLRLINKAHESLQKDLDTKEKEYRDFRSERAIQWRNKDGVTTLQERIASLEAKLASLQIQRAELQERLELLKQARDNGASQADLLAMIGAEAPSIRETPASMPEDPIAPLLLQMQTLREEYGFGPAHPQVRSLQNRIEHLRSTVKEPPPKPQAAAPVDPVKTHIASLEREIVSLSSSEKVLTTFLARDQESAQKLLASEVEEDRFRKDIGRSQQLFESVVKRLQELNLLKDFGGYDARRISEAGLGAKVEPKPVPIFVMAAVLGLLVGLGLAFLAETSDRSFRNVEDVRRRLNLPIIGQIPNLADDGSDLADGDKSSRLAPILCTFHNPMSREAETYRGVRTSLFFSSLSKGHKVVQITSPEMGDGKTTLAANLAISIAQAKKKVVLIDADFRRAAIHRLFGLSPKQGLATVLAGDAEIGEVLLPSGVPGLSLLPCGPTPSNPAELLSLPRFKELLDSLREQCDFVIVDTPPLLAVSDPCMVAPYVDGVILTFRLLEQDRTSAKRAKEILATLEANVVGVVINRVDTHADKYGYGYGAGYYYNEEETAGSNGHVKAPV